MIATEITIEERNVFSVPKNSRESLANSSDAENSDEVSVFERVRLVLGLTNRDMWKKKLKIWKLDKDFCMSVGLHTESIYDKLNGYGLRNSPRSPLWKEMVLTAPRECPTCYSALLNLNKGGPSTTWEEELIDPQPKWDNITHPSLESVFHLGGRTIKENWHHSQFPCSKVSACFSTYLFVTVETPKLSCYKIETIELQIAWREVHWALMLVAESFPRQIDTHQNMKLLTVYKNSGLSFHKLLTTSFDVVWR